ncbi:cobalamin biosynthesis protein CobG [Streptomyces sp. NPDC050085]|uniref:cobalamin biosynthesis protein CobG n=1 Tax=Streptomyces sp. NPDC050085 TaxID=3365600 RepID=UPI00379676A9
MSDSPMSPGDACPGALRLHAADDGFLARVRIPGGVLGVAAARALGEVAGRLGDGLLHLTSRGNVQLRGLRGGCDAELAAALSAAGLLPSAAHERVRNVVASPMSGLDGGGFVDVRSWLNGLDAGLCASAVTPGLSGRFLFALDDGRGDVASLRPDVLVRGVPGGRGVLCVDGAEFSVAYEDGARAAVVAAEVFVEAARSITGRRVWRVAELGLPEGELGRLVGERLEQVGVQATGLRPGPRASIAGGAECGFAPPFGTLTPTHWRDLIELAAQHPLQELRLTPWRRVVVPGVTAYDTDSPWTRVGACIGRPGCAKSHADVRADATARIGEAHPALPTYWSGCERRCGHPTGPYIDIVARPHGTYDITDPTERAEPRV